jgi:uncharacterized membrane protein
MFAAAKVPNELERKILRQNIAFRVVDIIVFAAVRINSFPERLKKRKGKMSSPHPADGPPSGAPGGKTSLGLDSNVGATLCYIGNIICCAGVILSVVFLITEKENRFVKFHALQNLFLTAAYVVLMILVQILSFVLDMARLGFISLLVSWGLWVILGFIFLVLWILAGMKAYGGQWYKLPFIGDLAWNMINKESNT